MTQTTEPRAQSSLQALREALDQAERQLQRLDGSNIEAYLVRLDQIEQMFADFAAEPEAVRSEQGRWEGLLNRISANPALIVNAARAAGGLAALRARHPPATARWWHLDTGLAARRGQSVRRIAITAGVIVLLLAAAYWGINAFTPSGPEAGSPAGVAGEIEQLAANQQWQEALAVVESARQTSPGDPELLVWEAVLAEQVGDAARAEAALAQAQAQFADQPAAFWLLVGNLRQRVGALERAEAAAQEALAAAPQDPQVTLLLANIAEARGDRAQAIDYLNQTIELAGDDNAELAAAARVRLGMLMQAVEPLPGAVPEPAETETTPQSP
jgi:tetratricopeptide (TPR) repeat protein